MLKSIVSFNVHAFPFLILIGDTMLNALPHLLHCAVTFALHRFRVDIKIQLQSFFQSLLQIYSS